MGSDDRSLTREALPATAVPSTSTVPVRRATARYCTVTGVPARTWLFTQHTTLPLRVPVDAL